MSIFKLLKNNPGPEMVFSFKLNSNLIEIYSQGEKVKCNKFYEEFIKEDLFHVEMIFDKYTVNKDRNFGAHFVANDQFDKQDILYEPSETHKIINSLTIIDFQDLLNDMQKSLIITDNNVEKLKRYYFKMFETLDEYSKIGKMFDQKLNIKYSYILKNIQRKLNILYLMIYRVNLNEENIELNYISNRDILVKIFSNIVSSLTELHNMIIARDIFLLIKTWSNNNNNHLICFMNTFQTTLLYSYYIKSQINLECYVSDGTKKCKKDESMLKEYIDKYYSYQCEDTLDWDNEILKAIEPKFECDFSMTITITPLPEIIEIEDY